MLLSPIEIIFTIPPFDHIFSPREHFVEVLDLLTVPDGLDDVEEGLVALLLGGAHHALVVSLIVAEL